MGMLFTILEGIASLWGWFRSSKDKQIGQTQQQATDLKGSLGLQQREEKAGTNAPQTAQELDDKLKKGDF